MVLSLNKRLRLINQIAISVNSSIIAHDSYIYYMDAEECLN